MSRAMVEALPDSDNFEEALRRFARQHVVDVLQPDVIRMRRMIIGEAARFPALARAWWKRAPQSTHETLAACFERAAHRGHLRLTDPLLAAQHFNWLLLAIPLEAAMFLGDAAVLTPPELERVADAGVSVFLAAYGSRQP